MPHGVIRGYGPAAVDRRVDEPLALDAPHDDRAVAFVHRAILELPPQGHHGAGCLGCQKKAARGPVEPVHGTRTAQGVVTRRGGEIQRKRVFDRPEAIAVHHDTGRFLDHGDMLVLEHHAQAQHEGLRPGTLGIDVLDDLARQHPRAGSGDRSIDGELAPLYRLHDALARRENDKHIAGVLPETDPVRPLRNDMSRGDVHPINPTFLSLCGGIQTP